MARTIRIKLYKFDELKPEAQEKAIEDYREGIYSSGYYAWTEEVRETLKAFENIFPVKINKWEYGGRGEGVYFNMTCDDAVAELKGIRLATYIWNNYRTDLFKGKYYSIKNDSHKQMKHNRVESKWYERTKQWGNYYHSAITMDNSCVLTGMWIDMDILDPIYKFLDKPDKNTDFKELMEDCFHEWVKAANANIEDQTSDDYITNEIISNNYEYEKDGTQH